MPKAELSDLLRFMSDGQNQDLVAVGRKSPNPHHAQFFKTEFHSADYKLTKRGLYTRLQRLLNDPIFSKLLSSTSTFDLEKLINERKIIIFRLPL